MCIEGVTFERPRGGVHSLRVRTLADIGGRYIDNSCKRGGIPGQSSIRYE